MIFRYHLLAGVNTECWVLEVEQKLLSAARPNEGLKETANRAGH